MKKLLLLTILLGSSFAHGEESDGLAPEVTDLNAADISFALEKNLPYLKHPFINTAPRDRRDGIPVGKLGDNKDEVLAFTQEIAAGGHGQVDSLLIAHQGKLLFESYYRRGRANYPHYQMSITKSYTAMAIGRAIQLGLLTMSDLERPVVSFLKELDRSKLVPGAESITLHEAMHMRSGVRLEKPVIAKLMKQPEQLSGQGQIQAYLSHSAPITEASKAFKYQSADPSMTMQVLETVVPGGARKFIEQELLAKLGINSFSWQDDISGLPKSAAGSSMRSRDMLKWGLLVMNDGMWQGEQLIPAAFVAKATDRIHTNAQGTSYGYFWWRHSAEIDGRPVDIKSGRGAGGQFIMMFPEHELLIVVTAHQKGMGKMLKTVPERLVPGFVGGK